MQEGEVMYKIKVMGIDPSSSRIGLAVINEQGKLLEAHLVKPNKRDDLLVVRMAAMLLDVEEVINFARPDYIAIETPAVHAAGRIPGRAKGLAVYGFGAGAVWSLLRCLNTMADSQLKTYDAQEWTKRKPKKQRAEAVALRYPSYNMKKDPGLDVADAIQLAEICLKEIQIEARMPQAGKVKL